MKAMKLPIVFAAGAARIALPALIPSYSGHNGKTISAKIHKP